MSFRVHHEINPERSKPKSILELTVIILPSNPHIDEINTTSGPSTYGLLQCQTGNGKRCSKSLRLTRTNLYSTVLFQERKVPLEVGWTDKEHSIDAAKALTLIGFDILAGMLAMNRILSVLPNFAMVRHIFYSSVVLAVTTLASLK